MIIKYRPDIDGLRAVAVLLVVIYHAFPASLPGGFIGVDIFFVISGYLITSILKKEMQNGNYSIIEFYRRRIDRIYPALLVVMLSVFVFGWFTLFADEFMQMGKQIAGGATFVANIVLYSETGYFNTLSVTKPFLHLWSLGIEEQYYLVFPVILYFLYKRNINPLLSIVTLFVISFALNIFEVANDVEKTFYLPQYRFWELLAGSVLAMLLHGDKSKPVNKHISTLLSLSALALIIATSLQITSAVLFPGWYALIPVAASFVLIYTAQYSAPVNSLMSSRPFVYIGLISYPLYLWHWPLLSIARVINGDATSLKIRIALVVAAFVLASLTYIFLERPLRRVKSWTRKTLPLFISVLLVGAAGFYAFYSNGVPSRTIVEKNIAVNNQLNGAMWQYTQNGICNNKYHFNSISKMKWWFCELKDNRDPDIILLGNSYANHLYPGIANNKELSGLNVLSIGTSNAAYGVIEKNLNNSGLQYDYINGIIRDTSSIKTVIISGLNPEPDKTYIKALADRINLITSWGKRVVVFAPHVTISDNIKACFSRPLKQPESDCVTDDSERKNILKGFDKVKKALTGNNSVYFYDPNEAFCNNGKCSSIVDGMPVYRDDFKHLSEYASMRVGEGFVRWAKSNHPELVTNK